MPASYRQAPRHDPARWVARQGVRGPMSAQSGTRRLRDDLRARRPDVARDDAAIGDGAVEIALMVDGERRLMGTVTDGDVRRGSVLAGAQLDDEVAPQAQRFFTFVLPGMPRADVLELMQARSISAIPVVDDGGHLVGLHVMRELTGRGETAEHRGDHGRWPRHAPAPAHRALPKPMLRVAGRPILERIVLHLVGRASLHLRGPLPRPSDRGPLRRRLGLGCRIEYLREDAAARHGGRARCCPRRVQDDPYPLLVLNGDLVTGVDVGEPARVPRERRWLTRPSAMRQLRARRAVRGACPDGDRVVAHRGEAAAVVRGQHRHLRARPVRLLAVPRRRASVTMPELIAGVLRHGRSGRRRSRSRTTGSTSGSANSSPRPRGTRH